MRAIVLLVLIALPGAALPGPAEAQLLERVKSRVVQKTGERKRQTEEHLLERAAEPADSAAERVMAPVDSAAVRLGAGAGAAVAGIGRDRDAGAEVEGRIRAQLAEGRADLEGIAFEPGSEILTADSEPSLSALARVLGGESGLFLLQARADAGMTGDAAKRLAARRAAALERLLVEAGVPDERVFGTGDGAATGEGAFATVVSVR
jgi:outer membrane protein OmpA-like peptidoglycan-associated protein